MLYSIEHIILSLYQLAGGWILHKFTSRMYVLVGLSDPFDFSNRTMNSLQWNGFVFHGTYPACELQLVDSACGPVLPDTVWHCSWNNFVAEWKEGHVDHFHCSGCHCCSLVDAVWRNTDAESHCGSCDGGRGQFEDTGSKSASWVPQRKAW